VFTEGTSVGLDVRARSIAAAAIDGVAGELFQTKLTRPLSTTSPGSSACRVRWLMRSGRPVFGLYRHLAAAGIRCEVLAPSRLQKPAGDRVKTEANDAVHLARLLRLDQITPVAISTPDQEATRNLVRAGEDCRADLMRARRRMSKLLLLHGIVYYGGAAWTGKLERRRPSVYAISRLFSMPHGAETTTFGRQSSMRAASS
jgi:transposase